MRPESVGGTGFVVAGPGGAGAIFPMAGLIEASYRNPNPAHMRLAPRIQNAALAPILNPDS